MKKLKSLWWFLAPDDGASGPGGASPAAAPAAPSESAPAPSAEPAASTQESSIKLSDIAGGDRGTRTISPSKALGLPDAKSTLDAEIKKAEGKNPHVQVKAKSKESPAAQQQPPVPAPKPAEPAPSAPPATTNLPAKIKVGEKEYTEAELKALIDKPPQAEPAPTAPPVAPKPDAQKTPEEIAADQAAQAKATADKDAEWINANASSFKAEDLGLTAETFDKILSGGEEGVKAFVEAIGQVAARSALETRKAIAGELNPILEHYDKSLEPVLTMHRQVEEYQQYASFERDFPDLAGKGEAYAAVKNTLMKHYPDQVKKMTAQEFNSEIAGHIRATAQAFVGAAPQATAPAAPAVTKQPSVADLPPPPSNMPEPSATGSSGAAASPPPPTGQRGGIAGSTPPTGQQSMVNELMRRGGISV